MELETREYTAQAGRIIKAALSGRLLPAEITFHSFRHTVSTQLRNADANIREVWIDRLLGHEASHKSQGTTTYF